MIFGDLAGDFGDRFLSDTASIKFRRCIFVRVSEPCVCALLESAANDPGQVAQKGGLHWLAELAKVLSVAADSTAMVAFFLARLPALFHPPCEPDRSPTL